ncbi:MAG: hypothetical protein Q8P45_02160 [Candidatus Harrisonbacteria bacterium]|nr:hypothetical protein [Candidatus Harrisonbacteria bacterium]
MKFLGVFLVVLFSLPLLGLGQVTAQPELILSWKSNDYIPPLYEGKSFSSRDSLIQAALGLVESDRLVDLSSSEIRWYLDGRLIRSGAGLNTISFNTNESLLKDYILKAVVYRYKNGGDIEKESIITSRSPEVFIHTPSAGAFLSGSEVIFEALPYNFSSNIDDLLFTWSANDREVTGEGEDGRILDLNISAARPGDTLTIELQVENKRNELESGGSSKTYTIR